MNISLGQVLDGSAFQNHPPAFSPDGTRLVTADQAGGLQLWERKSTSAGSQFALVTQTQPSATKRQDVLGILWPPSGALLPILETGGLSLRRSEDLAEAGGEVAHPGKGPMALGGGGSWLAVQGESWVTLVDFPPLQQRRLQNFSRGGFEYFRLLALAADPNGPLLAVSDSGGQDETAMGAVLDSGTPQVTLFDVERNAVAAVVEQGHYVHQLAFDPWRGRLLTAYYHGMGVWLSTGEEQQRFHPYEGVSVRAFTVTERWIVTTPEYQIQPLRLDFWDAATYHHLATSTLSSKFVINWIVASPDGRTLLTP